MIIKFRPNWEKIISYRRKNNLCFYCGKPGNKKGYVLPTDFLDNPEIYKYIKNSKKGIHWYCYKCGVMVARK